MHDTSDCGIRTPNGAAISTQIGKIRRLGRIFGQPSHCIVVVPIDDSLIFGPFDGLESVPTKLATIAGAIPDAILGFKGHFTRHPNVMLGVPQILNITASTIHSHHTKKVAVHSVDTAIALDASAIAVHVNVTSKFQTSMLRTLGTLSDECDRYGLPLLAIMYPRAENGPKDENYDSLRTSDRIAYSRLVAHAVRVGVDLGADIIKTQFTGDIDSFQPVLAAASSVPLLIAGGPLRTALEALKTARVAIAAGASGVSFGRNVFGRQSAGAMIRALKLVVHDGIDPQAAMSSDLLDTEIEK